MQKIHYVHFLFSDVRYVSSCLYSYDLYFFPQVFLQREIKIIIVECSCFSKTKFFLTFTLISFELNGWLFFTWFMILYIWVTNHSVQYLTDVLEPLIHLIQFLIWRYFVCTVSNFSESVSLPLHCCRWISIETPVSVCFLYTLVSSCCPLQISWTSRKFSCPVLFKLYRLLLYELSC